MYLNYKETDHMAAFTWVQTSLYSFNPSYIKYMKNICHVPFKPSKCFKQSFSIVLTHKNISSYYDTMGCTGGAGVKVIHSPTQRLVV